VENYGIYCSKKEHKNKFMLVEWLFYILIFVFSLGQLDRINLANGVVLHLTDIFVLFVVIIGFYRFAQNKQIRTIIQSSIFKAIFIFTILGLLSLIINPLALSWSKLFISCLYLFRWVSYALIYFFVNSFSTISKHKILKYLIFSQLILLVIGFFQYFYYSDLRNLYYLGWDEHLYRMFSTILDPNFLAVQFSLFLLLLFGLLFSDYKIKFKNIFLSVIIVFTFIGLLLTYSRAGYIMTAVGVSVLLWLFQKKRIILGFIAILILGIVILPKNLHSAGVELWRTASITARSISATQAITILKNYPILGVGFNSYRYAQLHYGFIEKNNWEQSHSGAGTDNSFLFILATTGLIGFSAYLFLWVIIIKNTWKNYKKSEGLTYYISIVILASIASITVNSLFINSLFYPSIMFWMWTLLGLIDST
jgi:putative inorganic carbon (hco3(-)) transporter